MGAGSGNLSVVCSCPVPGVTRVHRVRGSSRHECTLNRAQQRVLAGSPRSPTPALGGIQRAQPDGAAEP